jgi:hypothetical protein
MRCVPAHHFTVAKASRWRSAIEDRPPYQREGAAWSVDKQQLFIDSLLNGYDVPKIYLHDLRGRHPTRVYAIVDGKQRLTTIWSFLDGDLPLAPEFALEAANAPTLPPGTVPPRGGQRFGELDVHWQRALLATYLSVVLIRDADEQDIEALFSRLNNGEPLNAAEKRNAMGGDAVRLIRELAQRPSFLERLPFTNRRHQHHDLAARLLVLEAARAADPDALPDLRSGALDAFVRERRRLAAHDRSTLAARVDAGLARLDATFRTADPLLGSPAQVLLAYLFLDRVRDRDQADPVELRTFLEWFQHQRLAALEHPAPGGDPALLEFTELMQHAVNDPRNVSRRLAILESAFERAGPRRAERERVR